MITGTPIIVGRDIRSKLSDLHGIYGRDQSLPDILDALNKRLSQARTLYGPERSLPAVVSGLYEKLDELRKIYGSDRIEDILDGILDRRKRLHRMAELQGKVMVSKAELAELQSIRQSFTKYVHDLAMNKRYEIMGVPYDQVLYRKFVNGNGEHR